MTTGFNMYTLIYVISMEFLSLSSRPVPPRETLLSGDERGETSAVRRLEETYRQSINSLSMLHAKSFSSSIFANPIFFLKLS